MTDSPMTQPAIDLAWPMPALGLDDQWIADLYAVADRSIPWVRANFVSSVDGAVTRDGVSGGLSSDVDQRVFGILRRLCDVVLVGAGTIRIEGYGPMKLDLESAVWRETNGLPRHPVLAIVSGALDLDPSSRVFTEAPVRPIVFTTTRADAAKISALERVADLIMCGDDEFDPVAAQLALVERGLPQVHCEGGPTLLGSLLAADAIDELCLTLNPTLESGTAGRIATGDLPVPRELALQHVLVSEHTLFLRFSRTS